MPPKFPKIDDDKLAAEHRNDTAENGTAAMPINRDDNPNGFKPEHLLELQEKITKEILSTKLKDDEMHELQVSETLITTMTGIKCVFALFASSFSLLQAKINHEILNSKVFNLEHQGLYGKKARNDKISSSPNRIKSSATAKARSLMNLHNNEAGRRVTFIFISLRLALCEKLHKIALLALISPMNVFLARSKAFAEFNNCNNEFSNAFRQSKFPAVKQARRMSSAMKFYGMVKRQ